MSLRILLKRLVFIMATLLVCPLAFIHWLYYRLTHSEKLFHAYGQLLALIPGLTGIYLRSAYYGLTIQKCSWDCQIHFGALITHLGVEIGKGVIISHFAEIGLATLGDEVLVGSHTMIVTAKRTHLPEMEQSKSGASDTPYQRLYIGNKTWIGNAAVILANVGNSCVIGAGSVVVKDIPNNSVAVGNPARVIRQV